MSKNNIVIATKDEALWTEVRDAQQAKIDDMERQLIVCKEVAKLARHKILLEKRK